jgi:hypothetical protein
VRRLRSPLGAVAPKTNKINFLLVLIFLMKLTFHTNTQAGFSMKYEVWSLKCEVAKWFLTALQ